MRIGGLTLLARGHVGIALCSVYTSWMPVVVAIAVEIQLHDGTRWVFDYAEDLLTTSPYHSTTEYLPAGGWYV